MDSGAKVTSGVNAVVPRRQAGEPRVLSIGQQRLWYLSQLTPNNAAYNVPYASRLHGPVQVEHLQKALSAVVERHEVLRTVVLASGGTPLPVLLKKWSVELKQFDLRQWPAEQREAEAQRLLTDESARPFNFARDLMLRAVLVRLSSDEHIFLHIAPHMAFEGGSVGVFYRDLAQFYEASTQGLAASLPDLPLQYCDYALWQRNYLQGEKLESLTRYWKETLTGASTLDLPLDYPRPAIHTMRGRRHFHEMPRDLILQAKQFFRESGTTPYRGLSAAFNVFLHAYSGATDISIGSPFGPRCSGIEDLIGFFVNTVVLHTDMAGNPTFREVMKRVDRVVRSAIEHSDLTFDKLVEAARPMRDSSRSPLFQVNFRAPKEPYPTLQIKGLTGETAQYIDNGTSKFDLALEIETSHGEACYFEYCVDLFTEETIIQMVEDFQNLLRDLIAQPDIPLDAVPRVRAMVQRVRERNPPRRD
jgi:hypothetical protein